MRLLSLEATEANENAKLDGVRIGAIGMTLTLARRASAFARSLLPVGAIVEVEHDLSHHPDLAD
jgi:pterin-4a-carbinolamine dehydratase